MGWWKQQHTGPPQPRSADTGEIDAFISHARWLLEWHNKRNDGFATRSVAILGFTGVILALLPRGFDLGSEITANLGIKIALFATSGLLLVTAACCIGVLAPRRTGATGIEQLRDEWRTYAEGEGTDRPRQNIAEALLHGTTSVPDSPLNDAEQEASRRGWWFKRAVLALLASVVSLTALVTQVFWQM